jgi:hypothetical protein
LTPPIDETSPEYIESIFCLGTEEVGFNCFMAKSSDLRRIIRPLWSSIENIPQNGPIVTRCHGR